MEAGGARGVLSGAGQDDLTHDQVVDLVAGDAGLLEGTLDRHSAQLGRGQRLQPTEQTADRRTDPGDDDVSGHEGASHQQTNVRLDDTQRRTSPASRGRRAYLRKTSHAREPDDVR